MLAFPLPEPRRPLLRQITGEPKDYYCRYDGEGDWTLSRGTNAESAARRFRRSSSWSGAEKRIDVMAPDGRVFYYTLKDLGRSRVLRPAMARF